MLGVLLFQFLLCWRVQAGPPVVETSPVLLDSFLPAGMQIIAHLTDLMKYEIRPGSPSGPTSTTIRPTKAHKPGIYSPKEPLGAVAYYSKSSPYQDYVAKLNKYPQRATNYFDRYNFKLTQKLPDDLDLIGQLPGDILRQINALEVNEDDFVDDQDVTVRKFMENYDDSDDILTPARNTYVIGNKKSPPTRAYVTLLSLYDLLNKESKKLQLSKYGGYTQQILKVLYETSSGTSAVQLRTILGKTVERRDTKDQQIVSKIKALVTDLEQSNSYINDALRYIPPLKFIL